VLSAPSERSAAPWSRPIGTTSRSAFLEDLAGRLDAAVTAGETKAVIVVAPPRALGVLRQAYSPRLRQAVRAEIDKDLVRMPVHEIEKHLVG
jgi:protein required for attachment to host cells